MSTQVLVNHHFSSSYCMHCINICKLFEHSRRLQITYQETLMWVCCAIFWWYTHMSGNCYPIFWWYIHISGNYYPIFWWYIHRSGNSGVSVLCNILVIYLHIRRLWCKCIMQYFGDVFTFVTTLGWWTGIMYLLVLKIV